MRSSLFILSLGFIAAFGWGLHSRLALFNETTTIDISGLKKSIAVIKSLEEMPLKEKQNLSEIDYLETDKRLALLNDKLSKEIKFQKNQSGLIGLNSETKESSVKTKIEQVTKVEVTYSRKHESKKAELKIEKIEPDHFQFNLDQQVVTESYQLANYNLKREFTFIAINENNTEKTNLVDEVKVAQAATLKNEEVKVTQASNEITKETKIEDKVNDDDFKTFEYSTDDGNLKVTKLNSQAVEQTLEPKIDQSQTYNMPESTQTAKESLATPQNISSNVSQVIAREMKSSESNAKQNNGNTGFEQFVDDSNQTPSVAQNNSEYSKNISAISSISKNSIVKSKAVNTHVTLHATAFSLQNGVEGDVKDFDVQAQVETNDVRSSINSEAKVEMLLDQKKNFKSISIISPDYIKTNANVEILNDEEREESIPLLSALSLEELLIRKKIDNVGGLLLVKLSPEILGLTLDKKSILQVALNENLKAIRDESKASYALYVGVVPGNVMVSLKTEKGTMNYLTNVNDNELTYDSQDFSKHEKIKIQLFNEELMSQNTTPLNLMNEDITSFGTGKNANKLTLNHYEFNQELTKNDSQNYFEIKKGEMDLFFGFKNNSKIIIPSQSYQDEVLKVLGVQNPEQSCVIQVNIKQGRQLNSIRHLAYTIDGVESFQLTALDKDGSFGEDISDTTSKIFLKGDRQGSVKMELKYLDDPEESLQTFCSPGIYLVEQL